MSLASASSSRRQLDIGKVLQDGLGALAHNLGPFFLLALFLQGIPSALITFAQMKGQANAVAILCIILGGVMSLVTVPMLQGALIYGTMRDLEGRRASLAECLKVGRKNWLWLLCLGILTGLAEALGFILLIVPGVFLLLRWSVAGPLVVMEGRGIQESMGRSADLTQNRRFSIFLLLLIFLAVSIVVQVILTILGLAIGGFTNVSRIQLVLSPVINVVTSMILATMVAALFRQLRGDAEGGAPEALAEVFA